MGITNGNGNKTRLNLGSRMGMNHWEWEGMGLTKTFPLTCTVFFIDFNILTVKVPAGVRSVFVICC